MKERSSVELYPDKLRYQRQLNKIITAISTATICGTPKNPVKNEKKCFQMTYSVKLEFRQTFKAFKASYFLIEKNSQRKK